MFWVKTNLQLADNDPTRCGPAIDYIALLFRFSDVQKQAERKPAPPGVLPVILGTTGEVRSYTLP